MKHIKGKMDFILDKIFKRIDINDEIINSILYNDAKSFGKIGSVESSYINHYLDGHDFDYISKKYDDLLYTSAGIYILNDSDFQNWSEIYIKAIKNTDFLLQWSDSDKKLLGNIKRKKNLSKSFIGLEPFTLGSNGWHHFLGDKKVLCVSPFSKSIKENIENYKYIWNKAHIGQLHTIQASYPEILEGKKPVSWKIKLDKVMDEINKVDFDVATIGYGGFSLIIGEYIRSMGKTSIHLGGSNQILYGIKGKRWDKNFEKYSWYGGEYWKRPHKNEVPEFSKMLEDGAYW
tara:strand:+ start:747 stop:1613 length:867 start_codon:yes stop_codon:yes gene_type:complete